MSFVTDDQIMRPTGESTRAIYCHMLHISLANSLKDRQYPEVLENSVPLILLLNRLRNIAPRLGCKQEFRLVDILTPEPRRTRYFFSAFINFIKFRTDEEIFSEQLSNERECIVFQEEFEKVKGELDITRNDIEKLSEKRETTKFSIQEKQAKIAELTAAKASSESFQGSLNADILSLTQETESTQETSRQLQRRSAELEAHLAALEKLVTSPTVVKASLQRATDSLESEHLRDMEAEQAFKEKARRTKNHLDIQADIQTAKSELDVVHFSKAQWQKTKERMKAKEDAIKILVRNLELQNMKIIAAQKMQTVAGEQTQREFEAVKARMQQSGTLGKSKLEEFSFVKIETQQKQDEAAKKRRVIEELERMNRDVDEKHLSALKQLSDTWKAFQTAFEEYCSRLPKLAESMKVH